MHGNYNYNSMHQWLNYVTTTTHQQLDSQLQVHEFGISDGCDSHQSYRAVSVIIGYTYTYQYKMNCCSKWCTFFSGIADTSG